MWDGANPNPAPDDGEASDVGRPPFGVALYSRRPAAREARAGLHPLGYQAIVRQESTLTCRCWSQRRTSRVGGQAVVSLRAGMVPPPERLVRLCHCGVALRRHNESALKRSM